MISFKFTKFWIWIRGSVANKKLAINCVNIYNPLDNGLKQEVWKDVGNFLIDHENEPCCVFSDFNGILNDEERSNCSYRRSDSKLFRLLLKDHDLWDVPLVNFKYTWFGPDNRSSKLDRALINHAWMGKENQWFSEGQ